MSESTAKRDGRNGGMREAMPETAAFIDRMRATFGAETIDRGITERRDQFWAIEGEHMVGHPFCHYPRLGPCEAPAGVKKK